MSFVNMHLFDLSFLFSPPQQCFYGLENLLPPKFGTANTKLDYKLKSNGYVGVLQISTNGKIDVIKKI
jgi:hypothetical protein